ncbi:MAG: GNA1162 family protein [Elusimicrobiota bacterium]
MPISKRILATATLVALIGACGKTLSVQVRRPGLDNLMARHRVALSQLYVVLEIPDAEAVVHEEFKYRPTWQETSVANPRIDGPALGRALMSKYGEAGIKSSGYQLSGPGSNLDQITRLFSPAGILYVTLEPVKTATTKTEAKDKKGQSVSRWIASVALSGQIRLVAADGAAILPPSRFSVSISGEIERENNATAWFDEKKAQLWEEASDKIVRAAAPRPSWNPRDLKRVILPSKKNAKIGQGFDSAQKGDWPGAEKLWKEAVADEDHPLAHHNLAVYDERENRFDDALGHYKNAKAAFERARSRIEGHWILFPSAWDEAMADLGLINEDKLIGAQPVKSDKEGVDWFNRDIAVLPFNNESNLVDAPDLLRHMAQARLQAQGYKVMDLGQVDLLLRQAGVTQGGQLAALTPKKTADALKAGLLLYGEVKIFNEIPLGIYHKREVETVLRLVEGATGGVIWENRKKILHEGVPQGGNAGVKMLGQLAKSLIERIAKAPLKEESEELVSRSLSLLPCAASK